MRYFAQFIVPIGIFLLVLFFALRQSRAKVSDDGGEQGADRATFLTILCLGSLVAVALGYFFHNYLG